MSLYREASEGGSPILADIFAAEAADECESFACEVLIVMCSSMLSSK
jgi:hypothetical protein